MTQLDPEIREQIYDLGLKVAKVKKAPFRAMLAWWAYDRREQRDPRKEPVGGTYTTNVTDDNPFGFEPHDPPWLDIFENAARLAALHDWGVRHMGFEPIASSEWYQSLEPELMDAYIDLKEETPQMDEHDIRLLDQCLVCVDEIAAKIQAAVDAKDTTPLTRLERAIFDEVKLQVPERDAPMPEAGDGDDGNPVLTIDVAGMVAEFGGEKCKFDSPTHWSRLEKLSRRPGMTVKMSATETSNLKKILRKAKLQVVADAIQWKSPNRYMLRTADLFVDLIEPPKPTEN